MQIELTKTEADQLVQLIDVAVKAAGLPAARVAAELTDRIVAAVKAETQEEPSGDPTVD